MIWFLKEVWPPIVKVHSKIGNEQPWAWGRAAAVGRSRALASPSYFIPQHVLATNCGPPMVLLRSGAGKPKGTHSSAWRASIWLQWKLTAPILNPLPKERRVLILCLGRDSPTSGKIDILGTLWCEAEWPRVSVSLAVPRLRYSRCLSISTVDLNGSLSAHEFTQPLLSCTLLPASESGVGSQLGGAWKWPTEMQRPRQCPILRVRCTPFKWQTWLSQKSFLSESGQTKGWKRDSPSEASCWLAYFLLAVSPLGWELSRKRPGHSFPMPATQQRFHQHLLSDEPGVEHTVLKGSEGPLGFFRLESHFVLTSS